MEELLTGVNWTAVITGAVAAFVVGWVWYSPYMFSKKWAAGIGIDINNGGGSMGLALFAQAVGTFLLAWVIGITQTTDSTAIAILIALTIAAIVKANGLFSQKSHYAIGVEAVYILVMVAVMLLAHAIF